jgi:hypothetical protein
MAAERLAKLRSAARMERSGMSAVLSDIYNPFQLMEGRSFACYALLLQLLHAFIANLLSIQSNVVSLVSHRCWQ